MDMKKILQALDNTASKPVEGANDIKKSLQILEEGANPHKVSLPVQMAMQHYQAPVVESKPKKGSILKKYFAEAEQEVEAAREQEQLRIQMYSRKIAQKVLGESKVSEAPIAYNKDEPMNPLIHSHKGVNQSTLKGRIMRARSQIKELADYAQYDDLNMWKTIVNHWPEVSMNIDQIDHGIQELSSLRKKGGIKSRGIDPTLEDELVNPEDAVKMDIPLLIRLLEYAREDAKTDMDLHNVAEMLINLSKDGDTLSMDQYDQIVGDQKLLPSPTDEGRNPCWKGYRQLGTKAKGGYRVPNCVPEKKKRFR